MKQYDITVNALPDDPRLDKVLPFYCKEVSRSEARRLIESGAVYLNRKRCQKNGKEIYEGDEIRFFLTNKETKKDDEGGLDILPESAVIFENEEILVVNKPPFLPTHETIDSTRHHLVLATQRLLAARDNKDPKQIYLGVHHRLDRDTSGCILFTKKKEANAPIAQAFQERTVHKTYLAVSLGAPKEKVFTIKSYIGQHPRNKRRFASVERNGKYAETEVSLVETKLYQSKKISLMMAKPLTGRTHQIRVHLSENYLPIIGDATYGVEFHKVPRLLLHAWKLEILGKSFHAPLPDDFQSLDFHEPKA